MISKQDLLLEVLQKNLNYQFKKSDLLETALTHVSYSNENKVDYNNERLEFLGDAVLQLVMSDLLYASFSSETEGELSKRRASLVNEKVLAQLANEMQLENYIRLGRGEFKTLGQKKPRILASALEALIGAMYLDSNLQVAHEFIKKHFTDLIVKNPQDLFDQDFKTQLQELTQKDLKLTPTYEVILEEGPSHDKIFRIQVRVGSEVFGEGIGKTKKQAEQVAAKKAIEKKWGTQ